MILIYYQKKKLFNLLMSYNINLDYITKLHKQNIDNNERSCIRYEVENWYLSIDFGDT